MMPPAGAIGEAYYQGLQSPCMKSKRGVAIFDERYPEKRVVSSGHNAPAIGRCDGSEECRENCSKICVHAEQAAIINANFYRTPRLELVHLKVVDQKPAFSGEPSCIECSKLILHAGITAVWLLHETGWGRYDADEFHQRTIDHLGLVCLEK